MGNTDQTDLSIRLRIERLSLQLSQFDVADLLGVSQKTVARWEKETSIPSDKLQLLHGHGFDVMYILTGQRMPSPVDGLSERESILLSRYRQLREDLRVSLELVTESMAAGQSTESAKPMKVLKG